jgi:3-dehydroquinate dehydratase type I
MINYCLPIIKTKKADVLKIINDNEKDYQYFEVWLDYIKDLDEAFIIKITTMLQERLILLFRRKNLEPIQMDIEKRIDTILLISKSESFLDLDISQQDELDYLQDSELHIHLILSYHNYKETPDDETIHDILLDMEKYKPMIYKITTTCNQETDAVRLLQFQKLLIAQNKKHIVLGMGKFGTITRVFGTLWGNEMIFAPKKKEEESAPDQLTKSELEKIFEKLDTSN